MNRKYSVAYEVIALATFCVVAILGTNVCLGFSKTYTEDANCQLIRQRYNLSADYVCTLSQEYSENGSSFIQVTFNQPNNYFNQKNYTINEISKEIKIINSTT